MTLVDVTRRYESRDKAPAIEVLRGITFEIAPGESIAIVGPSGSGKSTLLNIVGTLDRPTSGQVKLEGSDLSRMTEVQLASVRNRKIGFVFQAHYLLPQCTVLENVLVPTLADSDRSARDGAEERARTLLQRVGLGERLDIGPANCPAANASAWPW